MKIKLKQINKNPFRDLKKYPLDTDKVKKLEKSIQETDFWDNLLARSVDNQIQLAYGHHRLQALKNIYGDSFEIDINVKNIDDKTMFKIMVNENDSWYDSVSNIDEAAEKAIDIISKNQNKDKEKVTVKDLQSFLGWSFGKAKYSITRINAVRNGKITRDTLNNIKTSSVATSFVNSINGAKKEHIEIVAKEIVKQDLSHIHVSEYTKERLFDLKHPTVQNKKNNITKDVKQKLKNISDRAAQTQLDISKLKDFLNQCSTNDTALLYEIGIAIKTIKKLKEVIENLEKNHAQIISNNLKITI
tara:strand:- start:525 stop:1430 length:906 start_codon:yes stop_codon:yes gene_type:complete